MDVEKYISWKDRLLSYEPLPFTVDIDKKISGFKYIRNEEALNSFRYLSLCLVVIICAVADAVLSGFFGQYSDLCCLIGMVCGMGLYFFIPEFISCVKRYLFFSRIVKQLRIKEGN